MTSTTHNDARITPERMRDVLGHFATGVAVITGMDGHAPVGLAVQSFASVSLEPPLVLFCPAETSQSWPRIREGGAFCANLLGRDQDEVCATFARSGVDKFAGLDWTRGTTGAPRLADCVAWVEAEVEQEITAGDHTVVIARVRALQQGAGDPLLYFRGSYGAFGTL